MASLYDLTVQLFYQLSNLFFWPVSVALIVLLIWSLIELGRLFANIWQKRSDRRTDLNALGNVLDKGFARVTGSGTQIGGVPVSLVMCDSARLSTSHSSFPGAGLGTSPAKLSSNKLPPTFTRHSLSSARTSLVCTVLCTGICESPAFSSSPSVEPRCTRVTSTSSTPEMPLAPGVVAGLGEADRGGGTQGVRTAL